MSIFEPDSLQMQMQNLGCDCDRCLARIWPCRQFEPDDDTQKGTPAMSDERYPEYLYELTINVSVRHLARNFSVRWDCPEGHTFATNLLDDIIKTFIAENDDAKIQICKTALPQRK